MMNQKYLHALCILILTTNIGRLYQNHFLAKQINMMKMHQL